jgi:flavin-dependent thymidylate synthase
MLNSVQLIGSYGGDEAHARSAWCSTDPTLTPEKIARIPKLLEFLVKGSDGKSHETPFEKSIIHFMVTGEIASHIHLLKHRIAVSINTESARYKELSDKWYVPPDWPEKEQMYLNEFCQTAFASYHQCYDALIAHGFDKKRAKESARFYLPYATQLVFDVSFNFRSFVHFCYLRAKDGAQLEIRQIAKEMIRQIDEIRTEESPDRSPFHHSLRAWKLDVLAGINPPAPPVREPLTFKQLQEENKKWCQHNFDRSYPDRDNGWKPIFGVMEEVGELAHSILKQSQGIRGTTEEHEAKAKDAVADATVFLADVCSMYGWDYQTVIEETWDEVKKRDWKKNKEEGK